MSLQEPFDRETLIRYRLERASETLRDAWVLVKGEGSPFSIINRAYYAMFYAVLALLVSEGLSATRHSMAISLFDRFFIKHGRLPKHMSKALHQAFDLRQTGDYRILKRPTREQALEILKAAQEFVREVYRYFGYSPEHPS